MRNQELAFDDANGLRSLYGPRILPTARNFEDSDLTTASFFELPMADASATGYFAASSNVVGIPTGNITIAGYARSATLPGQPIMFGWNWEDGATLGFTPIPTYANPAAHVLGAAETPTYRVVSTHRYRDTPDSRRYTRRVRASLYSRSGGYWSTLTHDPLAGTLGDTPVGGVAVAYDPTSQALIHVFRSDTGQVQILGLGVSLTWSAVVNTGLSSFATPAVACSSTSCFLGLVERPRVVPMASPIRSTRLQVCEFTWLQGISSFTAEPCITSSWNATGNISGAVVRRSDGTNDFVLTTTHISYGASFGAGRWGTRTYAYRHRENSPTFDLLLPEISNTLWTHSFSPIGGTTVHAESFLFTSY